MAEDNSLKALHDLLAQIRAGQVAQPRGELAPVTASQVVPRFTTALGIANNLLTQLGYARLGQILQGQGATDQSRQDMVNKLVAHLGAAMLRSSAGAAVQPASDIQGQLNQRQAVAEQEIKQKRAQSDLGLLLDTLIKPALMQRSGQVNVAQMGYDLERQNYQQQQQMYQTLSSILSGAADIYKQYKQNNPNNTGNTNSGSGNGTN